MDNAVNTYYNPKKDIFYTESELKNMGIIVSSDVLNKLGFYPVVESYPEYNPLVEKLEVKSLKEKTGSTKYYIRKYKTVSLSKKELESSLTRVVEIKERDIANYIDNSMKEYLSKYSEVERMTFDQQRSEVEGWIKDKNYPTPMIDKLSEVRGITRDELLEKAEAKVKAFQDMSAKLIGEQQNYKDNLNGILEDSKFSIKQKILAINKLNPSM